MEGVGLDKRLGRSFLYPGVGYGGSCFPKDVKALIAIAQEKGYDFTLLKAVDQINKQAADHFIQKIISHFNNDVKNKKIAVLGLSFKPNTDDMRDAPSIQIIKALTEKGATIVAYDPVAMENSKHVLPESVVFAVNPYEAADGADAVAVVTEWNEFQQLDLSALAKKCKNPVLFDGRNVYDPTRVKQHGFVYYGVGRM
jgi:UDPglucose 6-dehydrogenase